MTSKSPITFVTVCKARLAHLRQSLPVAAGQAPCVVVDYACPEGTGDWVSANHPDVELLRISQSASFSVAAGRNAGASLAKTEWLCFLDADVIPVAHFVEAVTPLLRAGHFYRPWPLTADNWGTVICARTDFERVAGYDVVFDGWGGEDDDLYHRLQLAGVNPAHWPGYLLSAIAHGDQTRMRFHAVKDREISRRLNFAYMRMKNDLRTMLGEEPAIPLRRAVFAEVKRVLSDSLHVGSPAQISITLPDSGLLPGWQAGRTLIYTFPPTSLVPPQIDAVVPRKLPDAAGRLPMPFIIGTGRCGSTLLRLMLDSHPALAIPDETHFIPRLALLANQGADARQLVEALQVDSRWESWGIDPPQLAARANSHDASPLASVLRAFFECYASRFGKSRYGDKTPPYVHEMPRIRQLFPEARFVHLVRDGRDVALSMRESAWWGPKTLAETAAWWSNTILTARAHGAGAPDYLEVRFEDLVLQPEATLRRICEFIDLRWNATMLRYHEQADERLKELVSFETESGEHISTNRVRDLHKLTREPLNASRIGIWRKEMSRAEIREFDLLAGPLLHEFGYETSTE
jgi:hypothetical protein